MKKKAFIISLLWLGYAVSYAQLPQTKSPGPGRTEMASGKYVALVIGVSEYPYLASKDQLTYPVKDAKKLYDLLETYNFRKDNIIPLLNPRTSDFWQGLEQIKSRVKPGDNLLIFVSLHGELIMEAGQTTYFWLPKDAKPNKPDSWISVAAFVDNLKQIPYKQLLIVLDACYGGSIFTINSSRQNPVFAGTYERNKGGGPGRPTLAEPSQRQIETLLDLPSSKAITSGTDIQQVPDYSLFFGAFYDALASYNQQYLLGNSLYNSVLNSVMSKSDNIPLYEIITDLSNERGGDFIFYNPKGLPLRKEARQSKTIVESTIAETTLEVAKGETIHISATGSIRVGTWVGVVTPSGKEHLDNFMVPIDKSYNKVRQYPHGALLYRISPNTDWHYCGEKCSLTATKSGQMTIEFMVNDREPGNNSGTFDVTTVVR